MNRLTAFLDWIDEAAGALIRLAYLAAGITAVAVYFGAGHLPAQIEAPLNAALPWVLAFAVETHTYITARRVLASWRDMQASSTGSHARERAVRGLWVNLVVLTALLAFSAWNQLGYLAATWSPPSTFLPLPRPVAYLVRALVVPGAFMCAAFLAPMAEPIAAQLETEARATLADVFKIARKQRKAFLKEAEAAGRDMTGALVELVPDPEARRIIAHAYGAIRGTPTTTPTTTALSRPVPSLSVATLSVPAVPTTPDVEMPLPPDPPSPEPGPGRGASTDLMHEPSAGAGSGLALVPSPGGSAPAANVRRKRGRRAARATRQHEADQALRAQRIRRTAELLDEDPDLTPRALAKELHCGWGTARWLIDNHHALSERRAG